MLTQSWQTRDSSKACWIFKNNLKINFQVPNNMCFFDANFGAQIGIQIKARQLEF
jgi:hypothetical protein